jgi:hypothetical protein
MTAGRHAVPLHTLRECADILELAANHLPEDRANAMRFLAWLARHAEDEQIDDIMYYAEAWRNL